MAVRDKYQSLIDLANQSGVSNLQVSEEGDVLHVTGTAPSEDAKKQVWDEYGRLDPDMRSGDLVLNLEVGGGTWGEGGGEETYTVKGGDTLSAIGKHHGVSWQEIHEANKDVIGDDPDKIRPGQTLRIPKKQ
jgi:nucleoid-associated protein YgaU